MHATQHYAQITELARHARFELARAADERVMAALVMKASRMAANSPAPKGPLAAAIAWCRGLRSRWQLARERRKAQREFEALDANALRDIGVQRSEFGSYWAEANGSARATRRRVRAGAPA
jgi:uncharacterized protein YjiS (DUF1127 family)